MTCLDSFFKKGAQLRHPILFHRVFCSIPSGLAAGMIVTASLVFFLPHMLIRLSSVPESYKQALLVQHLDAADKLSGSYIVEFFDHAAVL